MIRMFWSFCAVGLMLSQAHGFSALNERPNLWCYKSNGEKCSSEDMRDKKLSQILIFPTGYQENEQVKFYEDFMKLVSYMASSEGSLYGKVYGPKILYLAFWMPGDRLGSYGANFSAKIASHPTRAKAVQMNSDEVYSAIRTIRAEYYKELRPWAVGVILNTDEPMITANTTLANFAETKFGVARIPRSGLDSPYTATHEIAHAGLHFVDEYVERGFESMSIKLLDYVTPLVMLGSSWDSLKSSMEEMLGLYDFNISEILAANGNDNVDTSKYPSRVKTPGYSPDVYPYESGFFFGLGVFHDRGKNLMNSNLIVRGEDDGFAYAHSSSQKRVMKHSIDKTVKASRPNDRIRAAGPKNDWTQWTGATTKLLLFDADKNNPLQPTYSYTVQVGWYERNWHACFAGGFFPYPCYDNEWTTFEKTFQPRFRAFDLSSAKIYQGAGMLQQLFCSVGIGDVSVSGGRAFCEMSVSEMAKAYLPAMSFPVPYQEVEIPASQWMSDYYWRFSTTNARYTTGWTAWSKFTRKF